MLLDTSGLLCLHARSEAFHAEACELYNSAITRLTHNYVLAEFVALAQARRMPRAAALAFLDDLCATPEVEVVWVESTLHFEAEGLLKLRADKSYSLCDASELCVDATARNSRCVHNGSSLRSGRFSPFTQVIHIYSSNPHRCL